MNAERFNDQLWWYVARSGGLVALALSAASVLWGLLLSTRYLKSAARPKWLLDLHRFLGALTVVFTLVHVAGLMLDSFVSFSIVEVHVPFAANWKLVHLSSYALLWTGAVPAITAGTEPSNSVFLAIVGGGTGLITFLAAWRVLTAKPRRGRSGHSSQPTGAA
jgi:hypothetical protein